MIDRIDHVDQAREYLDKADQIVTRPDMEHRFAVLAHAHATLALAEQKRIENLIVLAGWVADGGKEGVGESLDALRVGVAGEVWEALGLAAEVPTR